MAAKKKKYARPVYLVDGSRTPFLKARGRPGAFKHAELGIYAARPLLQRMPFSADAFDEVIMGSTMPGPDEANIARIVALRLGCGEDMPAYTVHRNCASGMQALDSAAMSIASGRSELVLAGGRQPYQDDGNMCRCLYKPCFRSGRHLLLAFLGLTWFRL